MFGSLVKSYVKSIQRGEPPCLHEAEKEMVAYENQNIVRNAQDVYRKEMQQLIGESMPSVDIMDQFHVRCMETAIEYLRRNIIYDDVQLFLDTAKVCFIFYLILLYVSFLLTMFPSGHSKTVRAE